MGRQIDFFFTSEDEDNFITFVTENGGLIIDRNGDQYFKPESGDNESPFSRQLYIKFLQSKIMIRRSGYVENTNSDVIEFTRCISYKPKCLSYGRLWAEFILYNERGQPFRKDKWFEDKYNTYKKWIIKNCKISNDKHFYIGPLAYLLYKNEDYKMSSGPIYDVAFD